MNLEYFLVEAANEMPGQLTQADFVDAVACLNAEEWAKVHEALAEYNHVAVSITIRESICRQYQATIAGRAEKYLRDHLEAMKDDFDDIRRNAA